MALVRAWLGPPAAIPGFPAPARGKPAASRAQPIEHLGAGHADYCHSSTAACTTPVALQHCAVAAHRDLLQGGWPAENDLTGSPVAATGLLSIACPGASTVLRAGSSSRSSRSCSSWARSGVISRMLRALCREHHDWLLRGWGGICAGGGPASCGKASIACAPDRFLAQLSVRGESARCILQVGCS